MKLSSLLLYRYSLKLRKPIPVIHSEVHTREGILLELHDDKGNIAYGEIAPLPGLSEETLEQCHEQLLKFDDLFFDLDVPEEIQYLDGKLTAWLENHNLYPSVRFGWEMALLNLLATRHGCSLSKLLNPKAPANIEVNALIDSRDNALELAEDYIQNRFQALKLKVGAKSLEEEKHLIESLIESIKGRARLRIDINRKWLCDDVLQLTSNLDISSIEYIEEPFHDLTHIPHFFKLSHIPVALDESLNHSNCEDMIEINGVKTLVIKPTVYGGIEKTAITARLAANKNVNVVISSCFESFLGIDTLAHLAAAFTPSTAAGLDTLKYFENDFIIGVVPYSGSHWELPNRPIDSDHVNEKYLELII